MPGARVRAPPLLSSLRGAAGPEAILRGRHGPSRGLATTARKVPTAPQGVSRRLPLHARLRAVRPQLLHRVLAHLLVLPGADIGDLAGGVVIPSLARDRVGDGMT